MKKLLVTLSNGEAVKTFGLDKETRARLKQMAIGQASYAIECVKKGTHQLAEIRKLYFGNIRDEQELKYFKQ